MARRTAAWFISGAVSAAAMLAQAGLPPKAPRADGLLAGRVLDAAGGPVGGAVVAIRSDPGGASQLPRPEGATGPVPVRTNAEGRFVFTNVPAGGYFLGVSKAGWLPGAFGRRRPGGSALPIVLTEAQHRNDLAITLWRPAVIAGVVTGDNGDPLVDVEVRAVQLVHVAGRRQMSGGLTVARMKTDDRGAYRFSDLVPGDYVVAVLTSVLSEPPGFDGAIRAANTTPSVYFQTMTATGAAPIVFDRATGLAAGGRSLVGSLSGLSGVPTTEGAWPVYPTTYHPYATTQSTATIVRAVSGAPQTAVNVDVRMVQTWQVSGVLTGPEGPAAWHAVHLLPADTGDTPLVDVGTAVTDMDGAFTFYGVPPGQYIARVIRVPPPGPGMRMGIAGGTGAIPYVATFGGGPTAGPPAGPTEPLLHVSADVTVADRHVRNLALALGEGLRVRGRVVLEETGPPPTPDQWRVASVSAVAANGREDREISASPLVQERPFATMGVWPGRYLLRVNPPRGWTLVRAQYQGRDISSTPFELASDIENVVITLTDRVRSLKGTVQPESGSRPSDAVVLMFPVEHEGWIDFGRTSRRVTSVRVADEGTFSIPAPPDGEYFVVAIPDAESNDWQAPATLVKLAGVADRFRMQGDAPPALTLRVRRIQ